MPFACSSTKSIRSSTNACRLVGTPDVAPRTIHQMRPTPMKPSRMETMIESRFSTQNPPPCSSPPSGFVKKVRWCWIYSDGVSSVASAICRTSVVAHKKRHGKNHQGHDEGCDKGADNRLAVSDEHQPQQQHGEADLDGFGTPRAQHA